MSTQTSPFGGLSGVRETVSPGSPADAVVFSGLGGNPAASAFIEGFMRPGGSPSGVTDDGLLPSILFNNTGGTYTPNISVVTPLEESLVAANPTLARKIGSFVNANKFLVYGAIFFAFVFLFRKVGK